MIAIWPIGVSLFTIGNFMKNILFGSAILILVCSACAVAQSLPIELKDLSAKGDRVIPKDELTEAQRSFLWKDTTSDKRGFITMPVEERYVTMVPRFSKNILTNKVVPENFEATIEKLKNHGYTLNGILREDKNRFDAIFDDSAATSIMFTKWNYRMAGAQITVAQEFFNQKINNIPAILSLSTTTAIKSGLWKASWWANGVSYELYVPDKVDVYGVPQRTPEEIITLANIFMVEDRN